MSKVRKIESVFKTTDGGEFSTGEEAAKHQAILDAKANWEDACRRYGEALLAAAKTADGEVVELSLMRDYWYVHPGFVGQMPRLLRVSFYRWNCTYDERDGLTITESTDGRCSHYKVSELYVDRQKARDALYKKQLETIDEFRKEALTLRK